VSVCVSVSVSSLSSILLLPASSATGSSEQQTHTLTHTTTMRAFARKLSDTLSGVGEPLSTHTLSEIDVLVTEHDEHHLPAVVSERTTLTDQLGRYFAERPATFLPYKEIDEVDEEQVCVCVLSECE